MAVSIGQYGGHVSFVGPIMMISGGLRVRLKLPSVQTTSSIYQFTWIATVKWNRGWLFNSVFEFTFISFSFSLWSCEALVEFRLVVAQQGEAPPFVRQFQNKFAYNTNNWGFPAFYNWEASQYP